MKILLDTHAVLWSFADTTKLSMTALKLLQDPQNEVLVSTVSAWEMAIKANLGKLQMPADLERYLLEQLQKRQMAFLPITLTHVTFVRNMPKIHGDPFDRLLIAQATLENIPLLTNETALFTQYGVQTIW
jgi:PIN domain nuclease of toxin-antitoxin system